MNEDIKKDIDLIEKYFREDYLEEKVGSYKALENISKKQLKLHLTNVDTTKTAIYKINNSVYEDQKEENELKQFIKFQYNYLGSIVPKYVLHGVSKETYMRKQIKNGETDPNTILGTRN